MQCLRPQREKQGDEELVSKASQDEPPYMPIVLAPCSGTITVDDAEETPSMADAACPDDMSQHETPGCKARPSPKAFAVLTLALAGNSAAAGQVHAQDASDPAPVSRSKDPKAQQGLADTTKEACSTPFSAPRHQDNGAEEVHAADLGGSAARGQSGTCRSSR